jgi:hypothetical protein
MSREVIDVVCVVIGDASPKLLWFNPGNTLFVYEYELITNKHLFNVQSHVRTLLHLRCSI